MTTERGDEEWPPWSRHAAVLSLTAVPIERVHTMEGGVEGQFARAPMWVVPEKQFALGEAERKHAGVLEVLKVSEVLEERVLAGMLEA